MSTTTTVRIAVARLEFTPSIPIFASIDVIAAKMADNKANTNHMKPSPFLPECLDLQAKILYFIYFLTISFYG